MKFNFMNKVFITFGIAFFIWTVADSIFNGFEFNVAYQFMAISIISSTLRYVIYTENIIKNMNYTLRNIIFAGTYMPVLLAFAFYFKWFPFEIEILVTFVIIFLLSFAIVALFYYQYFKKIGFEYNVKLQEFKNSQ